MNDCCRSTAEEILIELDETIHCEYACMPLTKLEELRLKYLETKE